MKSAATAPVAGKPSITTRTSPNPPAPAPRRLPARRPLVSLALVFMAGLVTSRWLLDSPAIPLTPRLLSGLGLTTTFLSLALLTFLLIRPRNRPPATSRRLRFGLAAGRHLAAFSLAVAWWAYRCPDQGPYPLGQGELFVRASGQVVEIQNPPPQGPPSPFEPVWRDRPLRRFAMGNAQLSTGSENAVESIDSIDSPASFNWPGTLAVAAADLQQPLALGDQVEVVGWLRFPPLPQNSGEEPRTHQPPVLWIETPLAVTPGLSEPGLASGQTGIAWLRDRFAATLDELRRAASRQLEEALPAEQQALARTVILGDRQAMSQAALEPYLRTGTVHLLVVSGMHVAILMGVAWTLLGGVTRRVSTRAAWTLAFIAAYVLLTGAHPPAVRAGMTLALLLIGYVLGRGAVATNSLAAAALVIVAYDPENLFRIGTQLSFLAVLIILLFGRLPASLRLIDPESHEQNSALLVLAQWALEIGWLSLVVWLFLAPLLIFHFHLVTLACVPLSVLLLPLVAGALSVGMLFLFAAPFLGDVATPLAMLCGGLLQTMQAIVTAVATMPGSVYTMASPPVWWIGTWYAGLLMPALYLDRPRYSRRYCCLLAAWLGLGIMWIMPGRAASQLDFHQLSVGHGICSVVRTPAGTIMYDCGSMVGPSVVSFSIAPWLREQGITAIDLLILSHADLDHFNGVSELLSSVRVGQVMVSPQFARSHEPGVLALYREFARRKIPISLLWAGDRLTMGTTQVEVLQPPPAELATTDNGDSVTLLVSEGDYRLLLTGDLAEEGLSNLLASPPVAVDVLVAPHHGGAESRPSALAAWCTPRVVIVSKGSRPLSERVRQEYEAAGALVLCTNEEGEIICRWEPNDLQVETLRSGTIQTLSPR